MLLCTPPTPCITITKAPPSLPPASSADSDDLRVEAGLRLGVPHFDHEVVGTADHPPPVVLHAAHRRHVAHEDTLSVRSVEPLIIMLSRIWDDHTPPQVVFCQDAPVATRLGRLEEILRFQERQHIQSQLLKEEGEEYERAGGADTLKSCILLPHSLCSHPPPFITTPARETGGEV
ncbi:hypothetical protein F7725_005833 [Dissostichus mawsoni]|uniref:Uncharacterized protein n=1 Tax=Dissostichus mawsoni TaxID=36200 RepID=A0A7J5YWK1_DISMA|nr:hypothetical protein F7725_005833 [Dissostichus mawsoni]